MPNAYFYDDEISSINLDDISKRGFPRHIISHIIQMGGRDELRIPQE